MHAMEIKQNTRNGSTIIRNHEADHGIGTDQTPDLVPTGTPMMIIIIICF